MTYITYFQRLTSELNKLTQLQFAIQSLKSCHCQFLY